MNNVVSHSQSYGIKQDFCSIHYLFRNSSVAANTGKQPVCAIRRSNPDLRAQVLTDLWTLDVLTQRVDSKSTSTSSKKGSVDIDMVPLFLQFPTLLLRRVPQPSRVILGVCVYTAGGGKAMLLVGGGPSISHSLHSSAGKFCFSACLEISAKVTVLLFEGHRLNCSQTRHRLQGLLACQPKARSFCPAQQQHP